MTSTCGGIRYSLPTRLSRLMLYRSAILIRVETSGSDLPASQLVYVERTTLRWWATSFWVSLFFFRKYISRSLSNDYSPPFFICDNYKRTREVDGIYLDKTINFVTLIQLNDSFWVCVKLIRTKVRFCGKICMWGLRTFHAYLHILFLHRLRNLDNKEFLNFLNNCLITAWLKFAKNVILWK